MPFTLSHPAVVVPLRSWMGPFGVMSALVIGSMTPDMPYFLHPLFAPFGIELTSQLSHTAMGLFVFNIPVGLGMFLLYRLVLRQPMLDLLPPRLAERLAVPSPGPHAKLWQVMIGAPVCVALGAWSHLLWDGCTHEGGAIVQMVPLLQTPLSTGDHGEFGFYRILQHTSTLAGLAVLGWMGVRHARGLMHEGESWAEVLWMPRRQLMALAALFVMAGITTLVIGLAGMPLSPGFQDVRLAIYRLGGASVATLGSALLAYGMAWHTLHALSALGQERRAAVLAANNENTAQAMAS